MKYLNKELTKVIDIDENEYIEFCKKNKINPQLSDSKKSYYREKLKLKNKEKPDHE